jgi:tRNA(Ile)-lysidine synthase
MAGPDPAVAAVRNAVRPVLSEIEPGGLALVACSGGADSLALAAALAFEAPRSGRRAGGVTVDHRLQEGSAERASQVAGTLRGFGLDPVECVTVTVDGDGGPEAAARDARYAALQAVAARLGTGGGSEGQGGAPGAAEPSGGGKHSGRNAVVLLGHTLNDQAETVLLRLARGSGGRSLAGMPAAFDRGGVRFVRPLLALDRATTRRACAALDLAAWDDPHNHDPAYTRVRVRRDALPALERALGPGVAEALARTAGMLRDDADALDAWAERAYAEAGADGLDVAVLAELPRAVRTRVLRRAAIEAGSPPGTLAAVHIEAVDRLITAWHGQQGVDLPGGGRAVRRYGRLLFSTSQGAPAGEP